MPTGWRCIQLDNKTSTVWRCPKCETRISTHVEVKEVTCSRHAGGATQMVEDDSMTLPFGSQSVKS